MRERTNRAGAACRTLGIAVFDAAFVLDGHVYTPQSKAAHSNGMPEETLKNLQCVGL